MKRILTILAILCAVAGCTQKNLVIIHTNDTHSHLEPERSGEYKGVGGVIERAAYIDSVVKANGRGNVLLLHAGDFNQGTSYYSVLGGQLEVDLVNAIGYDCITLGNHEFDNGIEDLAARLKQLNCPVVCANYDFSPFGLGEVVLPYTIINKAGMKIGIVGLTCDLTRVVDRNTSDRLPKYDPVESAQKWASFLKNEEKCDLVIALTHIGFEDEPFTDPALVRSTRDIDLVVGGHSHTFLDDIAYEKNLDGKDIPIVTDGCWGLELGKLVVSRKK